MLKKLFYKPKHSINTEKTFKLQVFISILVIALSLSSLSFVTWAWFTEVITVGNITIQAASYEISVLIEDKESDREPITLSNDIMKYTLEPNKKYTITLTANGTATAGFCKIIVEGQDYYTEQISTKDGENKLTFTIKSVTGGEITFIPNWGTYSGNNTIKDNNEVQIGDSTQRSEGIEIYEPIYSPDDTITIVPSNKPSQLEEDTKTDNLVPDVDENQGVIVPEEDVTQKPDLEDEFITSEGDETLETEKYNIDTEINISEDESLELKDN